MPPLNVMIVDDDRGDRKLLTRLLSRGEIDANVSEAMSADEALSSAEPALDALFVDFQMPSMSGVDAIPRIRQKWPRAAIFLMTGQGDEEVAKTAILQGAHDYITKNALKPNAIHRMLRNGVAVAQAQARLEEQREDLVTFAEVLVHDLQAPVRAMEYLTETIFEDLAGGSSDDALENLALLQKTSVQMKELLRSLSDHVRLDRDDTLEPVTPGDLVDRALTALDRDIAASGARIAVSLAPGEVTILCRVPQVAQVLQNLLSNAIKYAGAEPPDVLVRVGTRGSSVVIEVVDQGIGIPAEYHHRIFEPFKRVPGSPATSGTGLGLATCRKIVQRHGGDIWCRSELGHGATIGFSLPLAIPLQ